MHKRAANLALKKELGPKRYAENVPPKYANQEINLKNESKSTKGVEKQIYNCILFSKN